MIGEIFRKRVAVDTQTGTTYVSFHTNFCLDYYEGLIFFTAFFNLRFYVAITSKYACNILRLQKIKELECIVKGKW